MNEHVASYYAATINDNTRHPEFEGEETTDVCVIGGGYTGVSAALNLAERGYKVIVLEAERIGWGASGRNGGQICTAFNKSMADIESMVGSENARVFWQFEQEAKDIIRDRVKRHKIDCELGWGYLHVASKPSHVSHLYKTCEEWAKYGYTDTAVLNKTQLQERVGTEAYHGALWEQNGGQLHPLNYVLGLARAAVEAGVLIYEKSPVIDLKTGPNPVIKTARGRVKAKFVVCAGNGYLGNLVPKLNRRIMPVKSYILATEPLGDELARSLIRDNDCVTDTNNVCNYIRLSADGRLLFGGRANYSGIEPTNLFSLMKPRMLKIFPQLSKTRLDYAWGGTLGVSLNRMPHVGTIDSSVYFAQGFSGHGVAITGLCGKLIADAISGTAEKFDVMATIKHQPFPGGPIRMPMLAVGMLYYKLRDMLS